MPRLDQLLVERELCDSREKAKRLVLAGQVRINGQTARKPSDTVKPADELTIDAPEKFVSRGGHKLEHALNHFHLNVTGLTAIDLGASTGGFTDCLLQHGAAKVFAVDVGQGQLAWKLRQDPRVVVMEKTNARYLTCADFAPHQPSGDGAYHGAGSVSPSPLRRNLREENSLKNSRIELRNPREPISINRQKAATTSPSPGGEGRGEGGLPYSNVSPSLPFHAKEHSTPKADAPPADLIVIDCSFISLKKILPPALPLLKPGGCIVALIKPQFEAGKAEADKGRGVITDSAVHERVLTELQDFVSAQTGLSWRGVVQSPLLGPAGNKEFLTLIEKNS